MLNEAEEERSDDETKIDHIVMGDQRWIMAVKNITTNIAPEKTIMEIEQILARFGAKAILKQYEGRFPIGICFQLETEGGLIPFKLPMKIEQARMIIIQAVNERKLVRKFKWEPLLTEKALMVGWRIIKDWIYAQLSLIEMNYAQAIEIFLPYIYDNKTSKTFFEKIAQSNFLLALEPPDKKK